MTDPYSILGITRSATDDEVKKAYRAMCRKYHPDKNPGNQAAEEMFKVVQEAYETIMNERKNGSSQANTGSYSYGGGFYGNQGPSYTGQNSNYYQAAANYLNTRHYAEALNVLNNISDRDAMWYYLSALANAGLGNNYQAQEQARTAAAMEPGNVYYRNLVNQLANGGYAYGNMQQPYGGGYSNDCCTNFLCCNLLCNPCCDCDPFCCC